jgi:hypothetical protein
LLAEDPGAGGGVVMVDIFAEGVVEMSPAAMRMRSVLWQRALAIHRSQIAFARGAWTGALIIRMPVAVKQRRTRRVLPSLSLIRNFRPLVHSPRSMSALRASCTVQAAAGWAQPNEDQVKTEGRES